MSELSRTPPLGILMHYKDGLRAMVLKVGSDSSRRNVACRLEGDGKPYATSYYVGL